MIPIILRMAGIISKRIMTMFDIISSTGAEEGIEKHVHIISESVPYGPLV
ncbi:MAG: hypothetical protein P8Y70_18230 [Candidatus Lokiarchaeota archaeon]